MEAERIGRLVADERDAPVPELQQIAGRELAARDVVDDDVRQARARRVDEHARHACGFEALELLGRRDERDHEESVGTVAAAEHVERTLPAVGRLDVEERKVIGRALECGDHPAHALHR